MTVTTIHSRCGFDSNIYLLKGRSAILIDTGTGFDSENVISQIWRGLSGLRLSAVLLTHCHADHIGGLAAIVGEFGCPAYISEAECDVVSKGDPVISFADGLGVELTPVGCRKLLPTDVFDIGDHRLSVIPTPGHTAGSVCFYDECTAALFSGDTVFASGYGRTDLPTGSQSDMYSSLGKLCNVNIGILYPGHGPSAERGIDSVEKARKMMVVLH